MRVYHDSDCDLNLIRDKKIAIVGYGSQGRAHALNLRDSGAKHVRVALKAGSGSAVKAKAEKFEVMTVADAAKWADVIVLLTPDETQAEIYANEIAPNIKQGASLVFAHGFNVHFGFIQLRKDLDCWMVAPKEVGPVVRSEYEKGGGVAGLVAVHQDASGQAKPLALSYGAALGCGRAGIFETSFGEECEVDLFGEQAVLFGGLPPLMRAGFETLVEAGYAPEIAYFKCVQQVKLVADAIAVRGISGMNGIISNTAEYGGYIAEPQLITDATRKEMQRLLADIKSGTFAKQWMNENKTGGKFLEDQRKKISSHPLEAIGARLRAMIGKR
jgi:ketol-acid reductoisomerase